jgi:chaperone modulatory protein CbpM
MMQTVYGEILDESALTLEELARACAVEPDWVVRHVSSGALLCSVEQAAIVVDASGAAMAAPPHAWRFASGELRRALSLLRVERDFEADEDLAALVVDLCEEVRRLRSRLHSAGAP